MNIRKKELWLVTMDIKKPGETTEMRVVLGCYSSLEEAAIPEADRLYQEKRKAFLDRVRAYPDFLPTALLDQSNCRYISYCPPGPWEGKEYMRISIAPNYLFTDL